MNYMKAVKKLKKQLLLKNRDQVRDRISVTGPEFTEIVGTIKARNVKVIEIIRLVLTYFSFQLKMQR